MTYTRHGYERTFNTHSLRALLGRIVLQFLDHGRSVVAAIFTR